MRLIVSCILCLLCCAITGATDKHPGPRIISLYAAHTEVLLRLGARDNIIGVSWQETYDGPETADWEVPAFSVRDDIEKFLAAAPDLILVRQQHVASARHWKEAMEKAGIQVIPLQVTSASGLYEYWRGLARLVGKDRQAEEMIAAFDTRVAEIKAQATRLPFHPKVFIESMHREIKTFTKDSIPVWLVETAGGENIATDAEAASAGVVIADYGPERLLGKASEIDIFISQHGTMNRVDFSVIKSRDLYQTIKALQRGNVCTIEEAILSRPTPGLLDGLEQIATWIRIVTEQGDSEK